MRWVSDTGGGRAPISAGQGFTLIELMVVLAVLAIALTVAVPSFTTLIRNNQLLSAHYDLRGLLGTARSEAIAQRAFVTVCASEDGAGCSGSWEDGVIAFVDFDGDGTVDTGGGGADDLLFLVESADYQGLTVTLTGGRTSLRFDPRGSALGNDGTYVFCDVRGVESARGLNVLPAGQLRSLVDEDGDDIVNLPGDDNVTCP